MVTPDGVVATVGSMHRDYALASVTKPLTAWATLVAVEEGIVDLYRTVDDRGTTLRHLLAHASGLPFEGTSMSAAPGTRRIYSNSGFQRISEVVAEAAAMPFDQYVREAVLAPLEMTATSMRGDAAAGAHSTVDDMSRFAAELLQPTLVAPQTAATATEVHFPDIAGLVPGVGRFDPCEWGLGVEIKGSKSPHWMGTANSAATFGHFGGSGTFVWVDVGARTALVVLTDRPFEQWSAEALRLWPALSDAVLAEMAGVAG